MRPIILLRSPLDTFCQTKWSDNNIHFGLRIVKIPISATTCMHGSGEICRIVVLILILFCQTNWSDPKNLFWFQVHKKLSCWPKSLFGMHAWDGCKICRIVVLIRHQIANGLHVRKLPSALSNQAMISNLVAVVVAGASNAWYLTIFYGTEF